MHLGRVALEVFGGLVEVFEYSLGIELDVAVYEDVPEASQTLHVGAQGRAHDALGGERFQDLLVALGGPPKGSCQDVVAHVEYDLAAELQASFDEPLKIGIGADRISATLSVAPQSTNHLVQPSEPSIDAPRTEGHRGSPYK